MAHNSLLQGYNWETQYEDVQQQFPRSIQDEVISVYEVYVKEETVGADGRGDVPIASALPGGSDQLIQIQEQNVPAEENVVLFSHPVVEGPSSATPIRLVDKDDPRSRLHFVKYLKRDGKTLKIWECGICSKEFRHQYTLMRHLPTHTDERNFKCEACGKAFRQLSTLSQHRAIHSDARPYVCEFCKKTFNRVSTLISHRKTHSEHKPHKCHLCGKGFHQKGNLRNHVFTHTNERPYKCELCGKGFNQMSNLVCHKVKAHAHAERMQYACGICGKEFPRRFSLRSHEEYKHGIKYRNPAAIQEANDQAAMTKNVRIVHLLNGDRTTTVNFGEKEACNAAEYMESVVVDKIETKAMENAILQGQTPFALFKPAKGIPVLVKVSPTSNCKQVLTPATAEDLRLAGQMTVSPSLGGDAEGVKAVQIKVPVVATVTQKMEPDGLLSFLIESPGSDQEQDSLIEPIENRFPSSEEFLPHFQRQNPVCQTNSSASDDCAELMELAAQGGIQFVRATEDGRYEVMTNSEARDLMAQNSHDVTILDGEDADAINVVGTSNDVTIENSGGRMNVLDISSSHKSSPMDGIEMLGERDIRILESKSLDDHFSDGITFLDQSKMDDLILDSKILNDSVGEQEDLISGQQDLCVLNPTFSNSQQNDSMMTPTFQSPITSLLGKNQSGVSMLNDNFLYLKSSQALAELDSEEIIGSQQDDDYTSRMRMTEFDERETGSIMVPVNQPEVRILGTRNQNVKVLGHFEKIQEHGMVPMTSSSEVKILGRKNQSTELKVECKEIKILGNYEEFMRCNPEEIRISSGANQNGIGSKKEVKILGRKLENCLASGSAEFNGVRIMGGSKKLAAATVKIVPFDEPGTTLARDSSQDEKPTDKPMDLVQVKKVLSNF